MPEPEIARRCPVCGASIRDLAFFCPQCGKALPKRPGQTPAGAAERETTSKDTASLDGSEPPSQASFSDTVAIYPPDQAPQAPAGSRVRGTVGAKLQRATTLARDVEGDMIHRVQKVREISSVVLDEAGDDPGLRFVLVAAIVFVLFLVIVLLNKLIT
jgi:hypothetical protein